MARVFLKLARWFQCTGRVENLWFITTCPLAWWCPRLASELPVQFVKPKLLELHPGSTTGESRWDQAPARVPVLTQESEAHWAGLEADTQALLPVFFIFFKLHISSKYYWYLFLPPKYMDLECHSVCTGQCRGIFAYLLYFIHSWKILIGKKTWWMKICKCVYL